LYRIPDGAMIAGVCNGLAAYVKVDVAFVRIAFIVAALLTKGAGIIAYVVMMFVIPEAKTPEARAAAAGPPLNAKDVIDRAKKQTAEGRKEWASLEAATPPVAALWVARRRTDRVRSSRLGRAVRSRVRARAHRAVPADGSPDDLARQYGGDPQLAPGDEVPRRGRGAVAFIGPVGRDVGVLNHDRRSSILRAG
jgi:phage shock protein PspC (stress-responsive transcriptional regulator)